MYSLDNFNESNKRKIALCTHYYKKKCNITLSEDLIILKNY